MRIVKVLGGILGALLLAGLGFAAWVAYASDRKLSHTYATHTATFPIPFPLSEAQVQRARLTPEAAITLARTQASQRGRHLVESRYVCSACHGPNFAGGVMVDDPMIGRLLGRNLTRGKGSRTATYGPADWDRIVRHGVKPDGTPALMPSVDFQRMSDQELSDIVVYLQSQPPVDHEVPAPSLGPLGRVLVATGKLTLSAAAIARDDAHHGVTPPPTAATPAFGQHVASTCMGCHGANLGGGPIQGGAPSWPPAANLTPGPAGLGAWTFAQFATALREGKRPDGTLLREPMSEVVPHSRKLTEVELEGLWSYLRSVPAVESAR